MKSASWILLPALLLGTTVAQARDIYCDMKGGGSPNRVRDWYVVIDKARTPQLPGSKKPSIGCGVSFSSVGGMYRPLELVTKPTLGEVKTGRNSIHYRSSKSGEDFLSIRLHEVGRTGSLTSGVFQYRIHVVDRPL